MTRRRPLVAGNWKLHRTVDESVALARAIKHKLPREAAAEVMIAPVFTALWSVHEALGDESRVRLGAQNCHWEDEGAFTGEVSPPLLKDVGCEYVIAGHSERRHVFGEGDEQVRRKVGALLSHGLLPVLCVGETLEQREADESERVVLAQWDAAVEGLSGESLGRLVVAYEPVWAIGTGKTASPADAQQMHAALRARVSADFGDAAAQRLRILYGGSVKPSNAGALLAQPDVDGALVGGASLSADSFLSIVEAADA